MGQDVRNNKSMRDRVKLKKRLFAGCAVLGVALLGVVIFLVRIYFFSDTSSDRQLTKREDSVNTEKVQTENEVATASPTPEPTATSSPA